MIANIFLNPNKMTINIRYIHAISQASSGFELYALNPHFFASLSDPLVSLAHIVVLFFFFFFSLSHKWDASAQLS